MIKRISASFLLLVSFFAAGGIFWFAAGPTVEERTAALLEQQARAWEDPVLREESIDALRRGNPEWDFMRRTFLVLSLVDRSLEHPEERPRWTALIDGILERTLAEEEASGHPWFLLPYAKAKPWIDPSERSLFVDGEIGMMLGARRFLGDTPKLASAHRRRVAQLVAAFEGSPAGLPESYPDEAWLFCITNALVAIRMADVLDGSDHRALIQRFIEQIPSLKEPRSGLLASELTAAGRMLDGPEGSSLWLVVTNLLVLDREVAQEQYEGAIDALYTGAFGLSWAKEWGPDWQGPVDIDSGPIVPLLDASPASSGFAILATRAFGDETRHARLTRSLRGADLLMVLDPRLAELSKNPMGDVIILHGLTHGPLWERL